jgi:hypothetical protein
VGTTGARGRAHWIAKNAGNPAFRARVFYRDDPESQAAKWLLGMTDAPPSQRRYRGDDAGRCDQVPGDSLDESLIYRSGSPFQRWAYEHAARYFHAHGVRRYGAPRNGNVYAHLLDAEHFGLNFLSRAIADAVAMRFDSHKAGDRARAETNAVASQPCCFNLFVPLAQDLALASVVFSDLMDRHLVIDHTEIEFTPNKLRLLPGYELGDRDESLGDQSGSVGTDADVAIFTGREPSAESCSSSSNTSRPSSPRVARTMAARQNGGTCSVRCATVPSSWRWSPSLGVTSKDGFFAATPSTRTGS